MCNFICMNFEYINSNSRKITPLSEAVNHITYYIMQINWKKNHLKLGAFAVEMW